MHGSIHNPSGPQPQQSRQPKCSDRNRDQEPGTSSSTKVAAKALSLKWLEAIQSQADGTKPNIETYKCHNRCNACNSHFFGQQKPNDLLHFDLEHRVKLVRQGDGLMRHKALVPRLFEAWLKGAFQNSSRIQNDPGHHHLV